MTHDQHVITSMTWTLVLLQPSFPVKSKSISEVHSERSDAASNITNASSFEQPPSKDMLPLQPARKASSARLSASMYG